MRNKYFKIIIFTLFSSVTFSQAKSEVVTDTVKEKNTPYALLSTYYNTNFAPFKKGNIYLGVSLSLEDRIMENTENIFEKTLDGERTNFNILLKTGYYINDYSMLGLNVNFFENKFEGTLYREPDTLNSNTIKRGFSFTPNFRTSIPMTKNERLSFFTSAGLTIGKSNTLKRTTKNMDEIEKSYSDEFNFRLGLSPGVTFFAMENFALEIQLDVLGYELNIEEKTKNGVDESRDIRHNIDFKVNILSMKLGLAYYFKSKKNRTYGI